MSVLKYFKTTPGRPMRGRQALSVIFFLQICNEIPGKKKTRRPVAPPTGDRGLSPTPGATGPCRPPEGRLPPTLKALRSGSGHACSSVAKLWVRVTHAAQ